jgi:hypothetical protein
MLTDIQPSDDRELRRAEKRDRAAGSAGMSLLIPGLGQLLQRRFAAAAIQFGAVVTYGVAAIGAGWGRAAFLAIAWNIWSAVDAYRHDRQ